MKRFMLIKDSVKKFLSASYLEEMNIESFNIPNSTRITEINDPETVKRKRGGIKTYEDGEVVVGKQELEEEVRNIV